MSQKLREVILAYSTWLVSGRAGISFTVFKLEDGASGHGPGQHH